MDQSGNEGTAAAAPKKKRSVTSLTLGWLAEKLRRAEQIKEQVTSGQYQVDSDRVAASIANEED